MTQLERNWGAEPNRAPDLNDGDILLYDECGRVVEAHTYGNDNNGIDYRSHYFRVVKGSHGYGCWLLVKHGGGQERFQLDYNPTRCKQIFERLDSTERYLLMHMLFTVHRQAQVTARNDTKNLYTSAFVAGRLKKRKLPARGIVKVWIEPASA